ncbi:N-acetyltransferase [Marinobacterium mangrovicola]|uniref:N-acetyltransferase domain-containing protein n=1 Tax=Marinobacterium mangrovicola TaxID=1476959 RepID=A0A4V2PCU4_9GAMM|nr:N-acetyltransferase [Marinobacterium mangrovicola]TCK02656.1 hypothetical protein CLV83_4353 [Marinobacterium mangrovicola]
MSEIEFHSFKQVSPEDFMEILNEDSLRTHLIDHPYFDSVSVQAWMDEKINVDSIQGCRIRAVYIDGDLAGWCGIQPDDNRFELAIVISQKFWGFGISIFKSLMRWADEIGHKEVLFHLLDSRPEYKALNKMASKVHKTELLGRCFTTYYIPIGK